MSGIPTIDLVRTGENIKKLRKESGLSVRDLQEILGLRTSQAIYKWQQGVSLPTVDNLIILAKLWGKTIDEILVINQEIRHSA